MIGERVILTLEEAQARCRIWQERLRLSDWVIEVQILRRHEFINDAVSGEISIFWTHKEARLRLLDPIDYPPTCMSAYDMEGTLVHELLHIHVDSVGEDLEYLAKEQAINCITSALMTGCRPHTWDAGAPISARPS